jgi:hypothetical protein
VLRGIFTWLCRSLAPTLSGIREAFTCQAAVRLCPSPTCTCPTYCVTRRHAALCTDRNRSQPKVIPRLYRQSVPASKRPARCGTLNDPLDLPGALGSLKRRISVLVPAVPRPIDSVEKAKLTLHYCLESAQVVLSSTPTQCCSQPDMMLNMHAPCYFIHMGCSAKCVRAQPACLQ